jgi:hypothetical protein
VLRINYAPTEGYEADVGSNTTFDLVNCANTQRITREYGNLRDSIFLFHPMFDITVVSKRFRSCYLGFFDKCAPERKAIS